MVILAVVFGAAVMRLGGTLVMLCRLGVCLIGHDWDILFADECRADRSGSNSVRMKVTASDSASAFLF